MDGLSDDTDNNIKNNIKDIWHRLFQEQNKIHSTQKFQYWNKIKKCKLPDVHDEKWKSIPLKKIFANNFTNPPPEYKFNILNPDDMSLNIEAHRLVFINGFFSNTLSTQDTGPWKIKVIKRNIQHILPEPIQPEIFLYLTECLSYETIYISLPNNTTSEIPLYLLHINQGSDNKNILINFHYRHHIKIHKNSCGQIIEHFTSINEKNYFTGARTSIVVDDDAKIEHTKLTFENRASYHISHDDIHVHQNSIVQSNTFNIFGNHVNKHQISAMLYDKYASLSLNSLLLPVEQDIHNISTYVKHNPPGYSSSQQKHKIISANQGQGIFRGLIVVDTDATKIDGKILNKNLLLHHSSKVYSMPQLEIYADDVKCTHGATIGYINNEQIFYLCTRGISYHKACQIIVYAFAFEIIESIKNHSIRKKISERITNILAKIFKNEISHKKNSI